MTPTLPSIVDPSTVHESRPACHRPAAGKADDALMLLLHVQCTDVPLHVHRGRALPTKRHQHEAEK